MSLVDDYRRRLMRRRRECLDSVIATAAEQKDPVADDQVETVGRLIACVARHAPLSAERMLAPWSTPEGARGPSEGQRAVRPGQTWTHRDRRRSPVTVLAVDRASVWTDQGRTTVFRLLRDRRLAEPATSHHA